MHVQLIGDGADRPLLGVVITQDLSFDIRWCHHGRAPFGRVATDLDGGARNPDGRGPHSAAHTNGSARPAAGDVHLNLSRRSRSAASPAVDNHLAVVRVNRDASLFRVAPDTDA